MPLVGTLFSGPIDIIGDVRGEIGALLSLLDLRLPERTLSTARTAAGVLPLT